MKKNRWVLRLVSLLAISCVLSTTVSLAAEAGSTGDPLVTLSYLNETFLVYGGDAFQWADPHRPDRLRGDAAGGLRRVCIFLCARSH